MWTELWLRKIAACQRRARPSNGARDLDDRALGVNEGMNMNRVSVGKDLKTSKRSEMYRRAARKDVFGRGPTNEPPVDQVATFSH